MSQFETWTSNGAVALGLMTRNQRSAAEVPLWELYTMGELIRYYRRRLHQIHNSHPWAQEDLAVAIGTDKAHINRIERGLMHPKRETLLHICKALDLSWDESMNLLGSADYLLPQQRPTPNEIEAAVQCVRPLMEHAAYPVALMDQETRYCDGNDIFAYAMQGYPCRAASLAELRGMMRMQLLLNEKRRRWLKMVNLDYESLCWRFLARFRSQLPYWQRDPEYKAIVQGILSDDELSPIWTKLCLHSSDSHSCLFLDCEQPSFQHPKLGYFRCQVFRSRLADDERFIVGQHLPADAKSQRLFADLAIHFGVKTD